MRNFLNYLPGIVLPSLMLYFFFWVPLRRVRRARSWRETPCVIVSSSVSEDATDSGLYTLFVDFEYEFAGSSYSSSRYSFSPSSASAGRRGKRRIARRLAPGTTARCYVNPDNPQDAVIERGVTWDMVVWGLFGIVFLGVFLFFLAHDAF
jgi:hypothetical protein